jgi:hypothetical protein
LPSRNPLAPADARAARRRSRCGTSPEAADGSQAHCSRMIGRVASPRKGPSRRGVLRNASWCSQSRVAYPPKAGRVPPIPGCASLASGCPISTYPMRAFQREWLCPPNGTPASRERDARASLNLSAQRSPRHEEIRTSRCARCLPEEAASPARSSSALRSAAHPAHSPHPMEWTPAAHRAARSSR